MRHHLRELAPHILIPLAMLALIIFHNLPAAPAWLRSVHTTQAMKIERLERRIERLEMIARHIGYDWEAPDADKAKDLLIFSEPPAYNPPK